MKVKVILIGVLVLILIVLVGVDAHACDSSEVEDGINEVTSTIERVSYLINEEYQRRLEEQIEIEVTMNKYMAEIEVLHRIVEAEATGQSTEAKMNVAWTIVNRVESENFPNTIQEVVFQERQFQPVWDFRYGSVIVTESTIDAVACVLEGYGEHAGLYFMNKRWSSDGNIAWFENNLEELFTDDSGHTFYK